MKVEYIFHSGFTIETENYFLVFDYYKGNINIKNKKTIVFSTHGHADHFNPAIFKWAEDNPHILYVLSSDIKVEPSRNIYIMDPYESLKLHDIDIKSFGSTDLGLSFLINIDDKNIFFGGDLNWWYWEEDTKSEKLEMERAFKNEIEKLKGNTIDLAFFPVDPRLEANYYLGGKYLIDQLHPNVFVPMHFGENYDITHKFINKIAIEGTRIVEITKRNEIFEV